VVGALYDSRDDAYEPIFGAQNSIRLPTYWQIDARVEKSFRVSEAMTVRAYLEVLNVTDHGNAEELAYSADWSRQGYVTGLPTIAVVGTRVEF
jgi:outer membrane receptor for Fe3+-dicitrate